ncbi:hypothetical protein ECPA33_4967, partial [Escherichia coli PA33]
MLSNKVLLSSNDLLRLM